MNYPFIIAEIAQGYEGSAKLVELFVKAAAYAKADAIKFQIFYADELALPDYKYYQLYKSLELPLQTWEKAVKESHKHGMEFYSDIFGIDSFENLVSLGLDGYKIHATDITNFKLLKAVASAKKKVFLSTGGCLLEEIDTALQAFKGCEVTLMYGFQGEPTKLEDNNLNRIKTLREVYKKPVGFQDHTAGDSDCSLYTAFVAMGAGANILEKHLTLSRGAQMEDCISALSPEEFARWSNAARQLYPALGKKDWQLTESEIQYRAKVKRAVCSTRIIKKGEIIGQNDVTLKRTNNVKAIWEISQVVGKTANKVIPKNSPVEDKDLV